MSGVGGGWDQVAQLLNKFVLIHGKAESLILSGHGTFGGVNATNPLTALSLADNPAALAAIKSNLAPGAPIIVNACELGNQANALQQLADLTGHPVIANTGDTSWGNYGSGDWVRFDPKK